MKKLLLSLVAVMTFSLSLAQPSTERVEETIFDFIDEVNESKTFGNTYPGAVFSFYSHEAKGTLKVHEIVHSNSKDVYVAFVSFDVLGFETRIVTYYKKYRGEYYLTYTEFTTSKYTERLIAKKINDWIYINPFLLGMIQDDIKSML